MRRIAAAVVMCLFGATAVAEEVARSKSQAAEFKAVRLLSGLDHPWSMAWLTADEALIATRPGRLYRWLKSTGDLKEARGMPEVAEFGQGGLFDVKPAPDFATSGRILLVYAAEGRGGAATRVSEAKLSGTSVSGLRVLFDRMPGSGSGRHFGGRLRFDASGAFYVSFGDRGARDRAQDPGDPAGSVYRFPPDGPPELFSTGHRNPQGMDRHPETGAIWVHEHGPRGGDEVNLLKKGANYGWPIVTYGREYSGGRIADSGTGPGFESPLYYWDPSIAPSGMAFYSGDAFPGWQGDLLVGALRARTLVRLSLDGTKIVSEERLLRGTLGRIREVSVGPDGLVYLLTDADDGGLFRLEPL